MRARDEVVIEDHRSRWVVRVSENISLRSVTHQIIEKIKEVNHDTPKNGLIIDLKERSLHISEIEKLKAEIEEKCKISVYQVFSNTSDLLHQRRKPQHLSELPETFAYDKAFYIRSSIRCGRVADFEGPVVLLGNLNAGGSLKSTGAVCILGECSGEVWAGSSGDVNAFLFAFSFKPVRVRIGDCFIGASDVPADLYGGPVMCSITGSEITMRKYPEEILSKGCVTVE